MGIIQEAFIIPDDLMAKILTGECKRIGGVVRYAVGEHKGEIVKHLEPVELKTAKEAKGLWTKALEFVGTHKTGFIIGTTVMILVAAGGAVYVGIRKREPKVVKTFRSNLNNYINAIRNGNLSLNEINALSDALSNLKTYKHYEKFKLQLSTEEIGVLISRIYDYTERLSEINGFSLEGIDETKNQETDATIINLEKYLQRQKEWFLAA